MNDYDMPEIRCSLRNLSRVTEWYESAEACRVYQGCVAGLRSVGSSSRIFHCDVISFTMHKEDLLTKNNELGRGKPHPL